MPYLDRSAVLTILHNKLNNNITQNAIIQEIYHELLDVPSAEVEPFVVAQWELILRRDKKPMIQCSNCKRVFKYHKDATLWRCPQCGAHMGDDE